MRLSRSCLQFVICAIVAASLRLAMPLRAAEVDLLAELERAAAEAGIELDLPRWEITAEIDFAAGYRDNATLSALAPDSSPVFRGNVNTMAWRLPRNGFEWFTYFDATQTHFSSADVDDAQFFILRTEARWSASPRFTASLAAQALHHKEVIDASTLESGIISTAARLRQWGFEPAVKWDFAEHWSAKLKVPVGFNDYRPPLDDFADAELQLVIQRNLGRAGRVEFLAGRMLRDYDTRPRSTIGGRPLTGTHLEVAQWRGQIRHDFQAGKKLPWKLRTRAQYAVKNDNGSGWYDYDRRGCDAVWSATFGRWSWEIELAWDRYEYHVQRVGFGDPPRRKRHEYSERLRIERELRDGLSLYLEIEVMQNRSNDVFLTYDDALALVGCTWSR